MQNARDLKGTGSRGGDSGSIPPAMESGCDVGSPTPENFEMVHFVT